MAEFAKLNFDNVVIDVLCVNDNEISDANGKINENAGIEFLYKLTGHKNWLLTCLNGLIRKNYAGINYIYDPIKDAFIPPKPFDSWILDQETCKWKPPVPYPLQGNNYVWDETVLNWVKFEEFSG